MTVHDRCVRVHVLLRQRWLDGNVAASQGASEALLAAVATAIQCEGLGSELLRRLETEWAKELKADGYEGRESAADGKK